MKDYVIDVLMNIGVPAGIKGFTYICDAIELFNTDPYYPDGKISALYIDIAKKYHMMPRLLLPDVYRQSLLSDFFLSSALQNL